jgi:Protein of unknown function (DUF3237)
MAPETVLFSLDLARGMAAFQIAPRRSAPTRPAPPGPFSATPMSFAGAQGLHDANGKVADKPAAAGRTSSATPVLVLTLKIETEREAMSYEKIFEYDLDIISVTDYGANMEAMFAGQYSVPLQGAQFDVTLAGSIKGRMTGTIRGVDYLRVRADGRRELDLRATIETEDGSRIAFSAEGVGTPRDGEPMVDLAVKIDLTTAAAAYAWVNARPAWGAGYANLATGKIHIDAYLH